MDPVFFRRGRRLRYAGFHRIRDSVMPTSRGSCIDPRRIHVKNFRGVDAEETPTISHPIRTAWRLAPNKDRRSAMESGDWLVPRVSFVFMKTEPARWQTSVGIANVSCQDVLVNMFPCADAMGSLMPIDALP